MRRKRLMFGAAAAGLTAVALLLGGSAARLVDCEPGAAPDGGDDRHGGRTSSRAQAAVRMNPDDVAALDKLGLAYQQSARETGDPTYYTKSGEALRRALRVAPRDLIATSGLGSLALSRHRFARGARARAARARDLADDCAQLRRDRRRARRARPLPGGLPRVRRDGDHEAGPLVVRADRARPLPARRRPRRDRRAEARASTRPQARARRRRGRMSSSARSTSPSGGLLTPRLKPGARCARSPATRSATTRSRGRVRAGTLCSRRSAPSSRRVNRIPLPQYVPMLGDLYRVTGNDKQARKQYALIRVIERLLVRERRQDRPRDGTLRRRPRDPAARVARARASCPSRAAVDRR